MLVENESKNTEIALDTIKDITTPKPTHYTQSRSDEELVGFVATRKNQMLQKRPDEKWQQYVKQYEAVFVPYADGRSASNVPLERAIIELFVAEAIKRKTNFQFNGSIEDQFQAKVLEKVWKYDWSINNRESEIMNNEYLTAIFGTSVIFTGYNKSYRVISDFAGEDDEGKIKFQRKLQCKADILLQNVDIRNFWIDERANCIEEAQDCIYETYITYEEFLNLKLDKSYNNKILDSITASKNKNDDNRAFLMLEERRDTEAKFVKISMYWNTKLDRYIEIANDSTLIKQHPILNATHSLPFVIRQYSKNLFSIYGTGLCALLETFKSDMNKLREMIMESIKRSNQEVIAIGSNLTFDGNQFAFNNQFMKFKGNLQGNFHQLNGTPPNQAIFNRLQDLFREIAVFTGIDIMNILGEAQQTAYQTAIQKESSLQRVNIALKNRDEAYERLANLHKDNLQMFYPIKMVRELVEIDDDNEPIEEKEATYPSIEVPKMKNGKFGKTNEKELFEVTPEKIRGDIEIDVSTDLNVPTINEIEKEQKMQFFSQIVGVSQAYQADPSLEQIIPKKKAIRDLARLNNIDTEQQDDGDVSAEKAKLYKELQGMLQGGMNPAGGENPEMAAEMAATEQQPMILPNEEKSPADVDKSGQPPEIASVNTPNI